ncbi:MAG: neocarzinostatin apoprotein domain-containing protein [Jatrophihabitantaceae bacterium]
MTYRTETTSRTGIKRARHIVAASVGALLLCASAVIWSATPAAAATPSVTVTPSSGLTDGQSVTVTGSGFTVVPLIVVVQCATTATSSGAGCDTNDVQFVSSDPGGSFTATLKVRSSFSGTDCTKVACIVQAHEGTNPSTGLTGTSATLHFGAAAPASTTPAGTAKTTTAPGQANPPAVTTGGSSSGTTSGATDPGTNSPTQATKLPTGADTGRAVLTGPPLLAEVGLLLALVLLGAGLIGYRHSRR